MRALAALILVALAISAARASSVLAQASRGSTRDAPMALTSRATEDSMRAAIAPAIAEARRTYPDARRRFLAGLPPGRRFFVTTELRDSIGRHEQVFIAVDSLRSGRVFGRIANPVDLLTNYRMGQPYSLPEAELLDWMILQPDGSEEGNFVGKFLDSYWERLRASSVGDVPFAFASADTEFAVTGEFVGTVRVRADSLEVSLTHATARAHADVLPADPLHALRLRAILVMPVDSSGAWVIADTSAFVPIASELAGAKPLAVSPLHFVITRPRQAPLASFWLGFEFEAVAPRSARPPGRHFATFAHGSPAMFAGFR